MDDESSSDDDYDSDSSNSESDNEQSDYVDVSDEESSVQEVLVDGDESHDVFQYSSSNNASDDSEQVGAEISQSELETTVQTSRYPTRQRRKPPAWYIANAAKCSTDITVTTSDKPTLGEAMSATPEEREMWLSAIDNEFYSLDSKQTWQLDHSPKEQTLPTHVVLKVKRRSDGTVERFKARIVAGVIFRRMAKTTSKLMLLLCHFHLFVSSFTSCFFFF